MNTVDKPLFADTDSFALCFSGEAANARIVHGWSNLASVFFDEVVGGCLATADANEEWVQWSRDLNDPDEWTLDEERTPYSFHADIGEISHVTIYRLSA